MLEKAGHAPLGKQLLRQQLLLYGRIARAPDNDYLRMLTFCPDTLEPTTSVMVRRVGRPRNEWTSMLQKESLKMTPNEDVVVRNISKWKEQVEKYCG